jgi:iron complex transport system substrate-binding protein
MKLWCMVAALLLAAACSAHATITLQDQRGRSVTLAAPAQRVVSLSPALTESVCALQACARLVGTDRHSNWPASVAALPKLGGLEDTQIERIVALKPDLVLAALSTRAVDRLEALGLVVLALEPANLQETRQVMHTVARALGLDAQASAAWQHIEQQFATASARVPASQRGRSVYFEVASVPFAAGEASFIGEVLARLGLRNIVPKSLGTFPQLNPEFVLRAQPDIVIATRGAIAEMPTRPGWQQLRAVPRGHTCALSEAGIDVLLRAGPRLGEGALVLAECLVAVAQRGELPR